MATKQYLARRSQITDTAKSLFFTNGYEKTTVADIIETVGIAKGTFYHYFKSKEHLLETLIEIMSEGIVQEINCIAELPEISATEKISRYFCHAMVLKTKSIDLILPMLRVLYQPENLHLRISLQESSFHQTSLILAEIITEGIKSGEFRVDDAELCGEYIVRSFASLSEKTSQMIIDKHGTQELFVEMTRLFQFMEWAMERLLGVEKGTIKLSDKSEIKKMCLYTKEDSP